MGSALALGLAKGRIDAYPTTAYILTHISGKCSANCSFCPQARESHSSMGMLSRVVWPIYALKETAEAIDASKSVKRVCIQAANYPNVILDILRIVQRIRDSSEISISVSCNPLKREDLLTLRNAGVERVAIPLDAASSEVFQKCKGSDVKGSYKWVDHLEALKNAVAVFGREKVTTHLIVGLGETDLDLTVTMEEMVKLGIMPALFAFTPVRGTLLEAAPAPPVTRYRLMQLMQYYILKNGHHPSEASFSSGSLAKLGIPEQELSDALSSGTPFLTSGCPDCNRPYYNERPAGPIYNYPRPLTTSELAEVRQQIQSFI